MRYSSYSSVLVEAVENSNQSFYGVVGDTVTYVNIDGNPAPDSMWAFSGAPAQGDATVRGQLTITDITTADKVTIYYFLGDL